ncbi:MAG: hypothetical protein GF398_08360 [Chitinivibrionales bacterium]|nr:hypothetical protein [Chitinivibrionales bacterium]
MGKPAARLMDMTAHGGMITAPGCPTVLIGKMPAARMTDQHMCPMVTPPGVPHVGGPLVGPVPPTVFIGKIPAACMGDMAVCVGPPSTVLPPGCPTVLLGQAGGGGGGGAGSAKSAGSASTLKGKKPKTVEGTEKLPVEVQEWIAQAAQYQTPEQIEQSVKLVNDAFTQKDSAGSEEEEPIMLTLKDFVDILKAVESEEGYEAARFFASHLDYGAITGLAKDFVSGKNTDADNDPNIMPTRFMLLYGADDGKLQSIDDHPDRFEGEEHKINVGNLRKGLRLLGYDVKKDGPYDDEVLAAHVRYMASATITVPPEALNDLYEDESEIDDTDLGSLKICLKIDPDDSNSQDDTFTLFSTDSKKTYSQTKTVKDDTTKGNKTTELEFTDMPKNLDYSLEIDIGAQGGKELVFKDKPFGKWFS